jgi:prepilin-type processing-associated H-X9-DG protein
MPIPVPESSVGRPASLPLIADSAYLLFNSPERLMVAGWSKGRWFDYATEAGSTTNPAYSRHNGGSNILYGDGHAKWSAQRSMEPDPTRAAQIFPNNFKLPVNPVDRTDASGVVTLPADDRLK